jgi:hypothetical protein
MIVEGTVRISRHMQAFYIQFPLGEIAESIIETHPAGADRFYLCTGQYKARNEFIFNCVFKKC